jgi:hypothetical protein
MAVKRNAELMRMSLEKAIELYLATLATEGKSPSYIDWLKDRLVYMSGATLSALQTWLVERGTPEYLSDHVFIHRHQPLTSRYCLWCDSPLRPGPSIGPFGRSRERRPGNMYGRNMFRPYNRAGRCVHCHKCSHVSHTPGGYFRSEPG